ncbi:hypothetical protein IWW48_000268 [Coemansia sp. RSA 1200]|nr:hypothetical protein IWW48_000268 [Coemansia sp. RSA 1200]
MNRNSPRPSAHSKTSGFRQQTPSGNDPTSKPLNNQRPNRSNTSSSSSKPASFSEAATQDRQWPQVNGSNEGAANGSKNALGNPASIGGRGSNKGSANAAAGGGGSSGSGANARSHSREAPVRLPSRNSVSSNTPAIQFGSFNEQTRSSSPPPAQPQQQNQQQQQHQHHQQQQQRSPNAAATSGGVPVGLGRPTTKPSFGSISTHSASQEDNSTKRSPTSGGNVNASASSSSQQQQQQHSSDGSARQSHHGGRSHHHQQQRPGSRTSNQSRQSQGHGSGRKDSAGYKQSGPKGGPKPRDQGIDASNHTHNEAAAGYQNGQPMQASGPGTSVVHPAQPVVGMQPQSQMQAQQHQQLNPAMHPQQQPSHYTGGPYRGHSHQQQHMRPPHNQSPSGPYKHQAAGAHYAPHHHMATQPMSQPMGYPMPAPGQSPMQPPIMTTQPNMQPIQGWIPGPPPQFAYMPLGGPAYEQYYRPPPQTAGGPPPHSIYGVPTYSMPNPTHAGAPQLGAGGIMPPPGSMASGAQMPGMTATPMGGQPHHHGLSASAQTFVPGRRPVRIVNPTTNEEIDISQQQRLRSVSTASSTPRNAASGTASPAPGMVSDRRDTVATPVEQTPEEESAKPKFKIPSTRAIKIVNPNSVSAKPAETADSASDKTGAAEKPAAESMPAVSEEKTEAAPKQAAEAETAVKKPVVEEKPEAPAAPVPEAKSEVNEQPVVSAEAEAKDTPVSVEASKEEEKEPEKDAAAEAAAASETEPKPDSSAAVDELSSSLAATKIADKHAEEKSEEEPAASQTEEAVALKGDDTAISTPELEHKTIGDQGKKESEAEPAADSAEAENGEEEEEEEEEDGEIDEDEEPAQTPTTLQSRSRQVTFSEPPTPTSITRTLGREEVVEMYSGKNSAPTIVGDILRYPRAFLEQFNGVCDAPTSFHFEITNTDYRLSSDRGSGMRRSMSGSGRHREPMSSSNDFGAMGRFRHTAQPASHGGALTSDDRFRQSTEMRGRTDIGGRSTGMGGRSPSGQMRSLGSGRESRGGRNNVRGRGRGRGRGGSQHGGDRVGGMPGQIETLANVKPLEKSENRYVAKSLQRGKGSGEDDMDEEVYNRRMRSLLNKLTVDNFEPVSDELLEWGNKSANENDGRIVRHLIMLIFDKATDEATWAQMYARLCYKFICKISNNVVDRTLPPKEGNQLVGGFLVRKYLLSKCQEEFEKGWRVEMPLDMESEEYYEAAKIKRRGLGLVRFIGELYLLDILTPRIIQECIKRLLASYEDPEEEETESLCKLLTTVGKKIDQPTHKKLIDAYFARVKSMAENKKLISRIRFMLKDVLDLRQRDWVVANVKDAGPKTIAEIHEEAERKKAAEAAMRKAPSHGGRRSDMHPGRGEGYGGRRSGWNTMGGASGSGRNDQSQRTGDMTGFGNLSRSKGTATMSSSIGPGTNPFGLFSAGSRGWNSSSSNDSRRNRDDRSTVRASGLGGSGRTPSHSSRGADSTLASPEPVRSRNMFDMLSNDDEESHVSPRGDVARGGAPSKATQQQPSSALASRASESSAGAKPMESALLQRKIKSMIEEYVELKSDTEFIECFKELGEVNYQPAVFAIVSKVMDLRPDHVAQSLSAFAALRADDLVSEDIAISGLAEYSELLEDVALDSPNAFGFFGKLMAAFQVPFTRVPEALGDLATSVSSLTPSALSITMAYLKQLVDDEGVDEIRKSIETSKFDISQFCNPDRRADADIRRTLDLHDLLPLFPKYA